MARYKFNPKIIIGILLAICFGVSLIFRIALPYDKIFSGDLVKFASVDAYFQMRLVDNLVHNFPHLSNFDPYLIYPGGYNVSDIHFFNWFLAGIIWVIGLGSPTPHTIDVVGAYFPAILAALTVIPVYFIGKALYSRWAGVLAAALVAILPGEYLGRSVLGFTDTHVAETLLSTIIVLFLILAIKEARQRGLALDHLRQLDWTVITKAIIYTLLAGIFIGIYLITWQGALLFVFIVTVYYIVQFIIDHLRHKSIDYLGIIGVGSFLVALIIILPFSTGSLIRTSFTFAVFIPLILMAISRLMAYREIKPAYYPLALFGIAIVGTAIFYAINPDLLGTMLDQFRIFAPLGASATTTLEMQPFLYPQGSFTFSLAWGTYTTSFFIALCVLIYLIFYNAVYRRRSSSEENLFIIWSVIIFLLTLVQRRFAYYFVINVALLSAYFSWLVIWYAGLRRLTATPELAKVDVPYSREAPLQRTYYEIIGVPRNATKKEIKAAFRKLSSEYHRDQSRTPEAQERYKEVIRAYEVLSKPMQRAAYDSTGRERGERRKTRKYKFGQSIAPYYIGVVFAIIVIFFLVLFPNIGNSEETAKSARFTPSDAWQSSLDWMRENTPEPFGDPDAYYKLYEVPPGGKFEYPDSAYGVTSWWDYGYWIVRIAHRLPSANPGQKPEAITSVANLFLSQEEDSASEIMAKLDSSYVIGEFATCTQKFWAIVTWSGQEQDDFFSTYYVPSEDKLVPVRLFYPKYYRSMIVRLYNFNGEAVTDARPVVVSYDEKVHETGERYKLVTDAKEFTTYEGALKYIESQGSDNSRIVGNDPFISPVPLEAVQDYKLLYSSEYSVSYSDTGVIPEVKIFEYIGD